MTFAVLAGSFEARGEIFFESIRKKIIENGGVIVNENQKAHYVMFEDGYEPSLWKKYIDMKDELGRNIVSYRFIDLCIERGEILNHENAMHICPLPQAIPVKALSHLSISFTCCDRFDRDIWEGVCRLYGINIKEQE